MTELEAYEAEQWEMVAAWEVFMDKLAEVQPAAGEVVAS